MNLLEVESFDSTFGKKRTRKRPKLSSYTLEALAQEAQEKETGYKKEEDVGLMDEEEFKVNFLMGNFSSFRTRVEMCCS